MRMCKLSLSDESHSFSLMDIVFVWFLCVLEVAVRKRGLASNSCMTAVLTKLLCLK